MPEIREMTKAIKLNPASPDKSSIEYAAALLMRGGLVVFPTETVYGIGANLEDKEAIDRLYDVKKRPRNKPFTIHISSVGIIKDMDCEIPPMAEKLIKTFWPGPITLILKSGDAKLGFRMPENTIAKALLSRCNVPIVAPSANLSGETAPTEAGEVLRTLGGKVDLVLDGGKTEFGRESTVVDVTNFSYRIVREGAVGESEIEEALRGT